MVFRDKCFESPRNVVLQPGIKHYPSFIAIVFYFASMKDFLKESSVCSKEPSCYGLYSPFFLSILRIRRNDIIGIHTCVKIWFRKGFFHNLKDIILGTLSIEFGCNLS